MSLKFLITASMSESVLRGAFNSSLSLIICKIIQNKDFFAVRTVA
jgi:hypothetical protein